MRTSTPQESYSEMDAIAREDRWMRDAERGLGEFAEGNDFAATEKKKEEEDNVAE